MKSKEIVEPRRRLHGDAARLAVRLRSAISSSGIVLLVGGIGKHHGAGEVAIRMSMALASLYSEGKMLLLDANLKVPVANPHFGLKATKGLAHAVLTDETRLEAIDETAVPNLAVLPALDSDKEHTREILSAVGTPLLSRLRAHYQLILINGPEGADSFEFAVWAAHADQVILAAGQGVRKADIVEAKKTIEGVGSELAGIVLTYSD